MRFPNCEDSGKNIGGRDAISSDNPLRLVPNPAYVTPTTAKCERCGRVVEVRDNKLVRHAKVTMTCRPTT